MTAVIAQPALNGSEAAALSDGKVEIVAFYTWLRITWENEREAEITRVQRERGSQLDSAWYACGYYKALGCDRHGVTYRTVDDASELPGQYRKLDVDLGRGRIVLEHIESEW